MKDLNLMKNVTTVTMELPKMKKKKNSPAIIDKFNEFRGSCVY